MSLDDYVLEALSTHVRKIAELLVQSWPGNPSAPPLSAEVKDDGTPVTPVDYQSSQLLIEAIEGLYPGEPVLSEEGAVHQQMETLSSPYWIIDPLDGTRSYIAGRDDFSIHLARCFKGEPQIGIIHFPARGQLAIAVRGAGTTVNGQSIGVSRFAAVRDGALYIRNFELETSGALRSDEMDSGLALLKVANGELDGAVIKMVTHRDWDVAAAAVVITEAGGTVSDERGRAVVLGDVLPRYRYFVASNTVTHHQILTLLDKAVR